MSGAGKKEKSSVSYDMTFVILMPQKEVKSFLIFDILSGATGG
jgi:hypothetical protein